LVIFSSLAVASGVVTATTIIIVIVVVLVRTPVVVVAAVSITIRSLIPVEDTTFSRGMTTLAMETAILVVEIPTTPR